MATGRLVISIGRDETLHHQRVKPLTERELFFAARVLGAPEDRIAGWFGNHSRVEQDEFKRRLRGSRRGEDGSAGGLKRIFYGDEVVDGRRAKEAAWILGGLRGISMSEAKRQVRENPDLVKVLRGVQAMR